jgi:predicted MFS family arabinose efflux permease
MTTSPAVVNRLSTRVAAIAVTVMFVVNGAVIGGFGGALPSLRDKLGLDATQIAIMLFCGGAAAILSMQIGGRLADAIGAREITLAAVPFLTVGMIIIGLGQLYPVAIVGAILIGLGNGRS